MMMGDVCADCKRAAVWPTIQSLHILLATRPRQVGLICFMIGINQECESL